MAMATVTNGGAAATTKRMPPRPRKQAMTPDEFRTILRAAGVSQLEAAERLKVHKMTIWRWLQGKPFIDAANATHIRQTFNVEKK